MRLLLMLLLPLAPLANVGKTTASLATMMFTPGLTMAHMVCERDLAIDDAQLGWGQELNEGLKVKKVRVYIWIKILSFCHFFMLCWSFVQFQYLKQTKDRLSIVWCQGVPRGGEKKNWKSSVDTSIFGHLAFICWLHGCSGIHCLMNIDVHIGPGIVLFLCYVGVRFWRNEVRP